MIDIAAAAGIRLAAEGEKLIAECDGEIPAAIVADLKRYEAGILNELKQPSAAKAGLLNAPPPAAIPRPVPAPWPEPKITGTPPSGADHVPSRYEAG
jgi:hypothetical protein